MGKARPFTVSPRTAKSSLSNGHGNMGGRIRRRSLIRDANQSPVTETNVTRCRLDITNPLTDPTQVRIIAL